MVRPSGKYKIGFADLAFCDPSVPEGSSSLDVDPDKHLVGSLFYPTEMLIPEPSWFSSGPPRARWAPEYNYSLGFAKFVSGAMADAGKHSTISAVGAELTRLLMGPFGYLVGHATQLPAYKGVPIAVKHGPLPVVVITHGVGGNRMVHSLICCELASQGFVVLCIEHADRSASACHLVGPYQPDWLYFQRPGTGDAAVAMRAKQQLHRLKELSTAVRLLTAVNEGVSCPGLSFAAAPEGFIESLKGSLDMGCVASLGHSFGGGPAPAIAAQHATFKCGIGMDPFWSSLPPQSPVFTTFSTQSPILLIGSQSWNDPEEECSMKTDMVRQAEVVKAASSKDGHGGGTVVLVIRGTGHASFTDAEVLFGNLAPPFGGPKKMLKPSVVMPLLLETLLTFLKAHLPLTAEQSSIIDPSGPRRKVAPAAATAVAVPATAVGSATAVAAPGTQVRDTAVQGATSAMAPKASGGQQDGHFVLANSAGTGTVAGNADGRVGNRVLAEEKGVYESILGVENVFSLEVFP